jgi:hypothetical protein
LAEGLLGVFPVGYVLKSLNGSFDPPFIIEEGCCGEEKPSACKPGSRKVILHFIGSLDDGGFAKLTRIIARDHLFRSLINDKVGEGWPLRRIKGFPLVIGPNEIGCRNSGEIFKSAVAVADHVSVVYNKSGNRESLNDLGELFFTLS